MSQNQATQPSNSDILKAVEDMKLSLDTHIDESKQIHQDIQHSIQDVVEAVNTSSTAMTIELHDIKEDISGIKGEINHINKVMVTKSDLAEELAKVYSDITHIKNVMVTKDYLDDKLADLRDDLVPKITKTVKLLYHKKIFTNVDVQSVFGSQNSGVN